MSARPAATDVELGGLDTPNLPLLVRPSGADLDGAWCSANRARIERLLHQHGALLFRGFAVQGMADFEAMARALADDFPDFAEESSPRTQVVSIVQTSTDYPAQYPIQFHNEYSYSSAWPLKLFFYCQRPATSGGETPLADSRRVLTRLGQATLAKLRSTGVLYKRNYGTHLGVAWQKAFRTSSQREVEELFRERGISWRWGPRGTLHTTQRAEAVVRHPKTGEECWFNHAFFFNVRALEPIELREAMLEEPEEERPTNTYYGDGSPLEDDTIEELRAAYASERVQFRWQAGDVLLLDNMLASHSRRPFQGPRELFAIMGDPCPRADVQRP